MAQRVLLSVEDDDTEYYIIQMAVERSGVPVHLLRVPDGEQAIHFLERTHGFELAPRPDLILLNMNLPKRDGFEILTYIRHSEALRTIPVVMFTSCTGEQERKRALALGAEDFVSKPHSLTELIDSVASICTRFLAQG